MPRGDYARLSTFLFAFRRRIAGVIVLITVNAGLAVGPAFLTQRLIDEGAVPGDTRRVWFLGGALLTVGVVAACSTLAERWATAGLAEDVTARMRVDVFEHLQSQSAAFFAASRTGAIVSRLHGDVQGVRDLIARTLVTATSALVTLVVAGTAVLVLDWRIAAALLCLTPVLYVITTRFGAALRELTQRRLDAVADLDSMAAERLSQGGAEAIRLHGAADRETDEFRRRVRRVRDAAVRGAFLDARLGACLTVLLSLATSGVYVVAALLVAGDALSLGTMVASVALITRVYGPLAALPACRMELVAGTVSFERVREVMCASPGVRQPEDAQPVPGTSVAFTEVAFSYPQDHAAGPASLGPQPGEAGHDPTRPRRTSRRALEAVTFEVPAGTTLGIVGTSGAGKSTLARLLTRCWDVDAGKVEVGGLDVRRADLASLRRTVGVVAQDTFLFHTTVRENLLLARPHAGDEEIADACRTARIWDVVERLPNGLDTVLGDRGVRLSGGERQRLAIARLLLKAPEVVVLDEATSHLDASTERAVMEALQPFLARRTCLIITHRLSTVHRADRVLVMEHGRVTNQGTPVELRLVDTLQHARQRS
ncbi:ABC transporter ATP-binding protein [Streptomyces ruber]|uniref:ABC transporter ATP-binding protein n=2 Tax=Streptomyces TaxID=1883 RepID=A0A918BJ89_9ACTN|nr:ABC transporter ATP-binding protein [Streptomyces ruber]GGQ72088.1 ABC transporter ATP-binding protein [Streptomyces ruber]